MNHVLFTIPGLNHDVPGYGVMLMIGFLLSIWWATRRAEKSNANPDVILNCGFIALIAGVVGCRLMYVIHYWDRFKNQGSTVDIIWAILDVTKGGLEFYGGFVLTSIVVVIWLRYVEKVSIRWYLDIIAPSAALGLAIGRIGCFLNGCCYGGTCELPWAVEFPYGSPAQMHQWQGKLPNAGIPEELLVDIGGMLTPLSREQFDATAQEVATARSFVQAERGKIADLRARIEATSDDAKRTRLERQLREIRTAQLKAVGNLAPLVMTLEKYDLSLDELRAIAAQHGSQPVHPTQIYSFVTALIVALLLNALYYRRSFDGQVIFTLFIIEPVTRWLLEVIRADNPVDTVGVFTISQGIAVGLALVGILGMLWARTQPPRSPRARIWEPPADEKKSKASAPAT